MHKRLSAEVKAKLEAKGKSTKGIETFEAFYGMLKSEAVALQKEYQPKLRNGINITVDLINQVQKDKKDGDVDVRIKIAPNAEILETSIILNDLDNNFDDLSEAIRNSASLGREHPNIDAIEGIVGSIIEQLNTSRTDPNSKIEFILNAVNRNDVGVTSHKFTFLRKDRSGKPAFLTVKRNSGDNTCACCETNTGISSPHNVVTAAHAKQGINATLITILGATDFDASKGSKLYKYMIGTAESTGGSAPLPTKGEFQKQCEACEGSASGDNDGKFLAAQSLIQRANGIASPNGETSTSRGMDKQFQTTTPQTREYITAKRIKYLVDNFAKKLKQTSSGSEPIYQLATDQTKATAFLTLLTTNITSLVR